METERGVDFYIAFPLKSCYLLFISTILDVLNPLYVPGFMNDLGVPMRDLESHF